MALHVFLDMYKMHGSNFRAIVWQTLIKTKMHLRQIHYFSSSYDSPVLSDAFAHFRKKISPDVTSYGAVVSACEKDAEWQLALHLLRRWQLAKNTTADDSMIPLNCPKL